ncbi:MAG: GC-type dockerin domain-anchored protein [Phycisphaerales bacterium]
MKNFFLPAIAFMASMAFAAAAHAQPVNDNCAGATPITNGSVKPFNTQTATRDGTASCLNFSAARDIWFTYTSTEAEHVVLDLCGSGPMVKGLAVFADGCAGTPLGCNRTGGCGTGQPQLVLDTPGAGTYYIYLATLQSSGDFTGILTLNATPLAGQPTRDTCATAFPVGGSTTLAFDTTGLTTDRTSSCGGLNDAWYVWMPTKTGVGTVSTCGQTAGDTVLSAYASCGGAELACDDNFCGGASSITFPVTFGVPVWVRLASHGGEAVTGQVSFSVSLTPSNDLCENAQVLPGLGGYQVNTTFATTQGSGPTCKRSDEPDSRDLYFRYTAGNEGYITVDTLMVGGSSTNPSLIDTTLQILDGCGGTELTCNDDANNGTVASKTCPLAVTPGATYIIRVASRGQGGAFQLRLAAASAPTWSMPGDAIAEPGDPCAEYVDDPNRGCDGMSSQPGEYRTPIVLCQNYMGTAPSRTALAPNGVVVHDADTYTFTLTEPSIVTVTGQTQFRALANIWSGNCANQNFQLPVADTAPCSGVADFTLTIPDVLQPGVHNFTIGNWFDLSATCGINDQYWFRISTNHPCPAPAPCAADLGMQGGLPGSDHALDNNDFIAFINYFFAANAMADMGVQGGLAGHDGHFDNNDFIAFINAFFAGCP